MSDKASLRDREITRICNLLERSEHLFHFIIHRTLYTPTAYTSSGARGLGYNMAMAFAEVGIKSIAILDIQQDIGVSAALDLHSSTGIPTSFYKVDVRSPEAVDQAITNVVQDFGSIDVLVNSAGIVESVPPPYLSNTFYGNELSLKPLISAPTSPP